MNTCCRCYCLRQAHISSASTTPLSQSYLHIVLLVQLTRPKKAGKPAVVISIHESSESNNDDDIDASPLAMNAVWRRIEANEPVTVTLSWQHHPSGGSALGSLA